MADSDVQHVYPVNDLLEHDTDADDDRCWCNPRTELVGATSRIIIHNAFDGRE